MSGRIGPSSTASALKLLCAVGLAGRWCPTVTPGTGGASRALCEPEERVVCAARSAEPGAPDRRLRLEGTECCGLYRVVSPRPVGLLAGHRGAAAPLERAEPSRRGAACVGGPVEAWSRGLG
ncbi:hypothetical protein NDU88_001886 [Pleurodeles waltl]|uniref:Secreted protein n=1 Tax=Pleurodeles waltl TaxID=8319 RepID=A0AAV7M9F5_PLEWA|nr:hypothetical protein NDU88_001886 [Pleurodeles waltl]